MQGRDEERAVMLAGGGTVGEEGGAVVPGEGHGRGTSASFPIMVRSRRSGVV